MPRLTITALVALVLALSACGGDEESTSTPAQPPAAAPATTTEATNPPASSGETVAVTMQNIKFVPEEVTAKVGQKIEWTNEDSAPHNVTARSGADFASDTLNQGDTYEYTPTMEGEIGYVCTIHPGQTGSITVTK